MGYGGRSIASLLTRSYEEKIIIDSWPVCAFEKMADTCFVLFSYKIACHCKVA